MAQRTADMTDTYEIYVGNLAATVTDASLATAFAASGEIHTCLVCIDRMTSASKGYGFIHFKSKEAQQKACQAPFNYMSLDGFQVIVLPMDRDTTVFINGFDIRMAEEECRLETQALCGPVLHFELKTTGPPSFESKGFGFATFQTEEQMHTAIKRLTTGKIRGHRMKAEIARPLGDTGSGEAPTANITEIFVSNLNVCIDSDFLENFFCQWGELKRATIILDDSKKSRGFGFVDYQNKDDTEMAVRYSNNQVLCGQPIHVTLAKPDDKKDIRPGGDRDAPRGRGFRGGFGDRDRGFERGGRGSGRGGFGDRDRDRDRGFGDRGRDRGFGDRGRDRGFGDRDRGDRDRGGFGGRGRGGGRGGTWERGSGRRGGLDHHPYYQAQNQQGHGGQGGGRDHGGGRDYQAPQQQEYQQRQGGQNNSDFGGY